MKRWNYYPATFTQAQLDAMTLEDFGPFDEEDRELLRRSKHDLHQRLASDDPVVRLQACKESLAQIVTIVPNKDI